MLAFSLPARRTGSANTGIPELRGEIQCNGHEAGPECPAASPPQTAIICSMRQAQRKSRNPELRPMATAPLRLLILAFALPVSGCASMGLSDALLSDTSSSFKTSSTIRSQNSAAFDHESSSRSVAADYSPLQTSSDAANSDSPGSNSAIGETPAYAGGHAFVNRRARLGKPIPLPDKAETPPAIRNELPIEGRAIGNVSVRPSEVNFGSAGWQGIPDPSTADRSVKNTAARNQDEAFATDGGWNRDPDQSAQQNASEPTSNLRGDESGSSASPGLTQAATGPQSQLDENPTDDMTTTADTGGATAKEPTVLDRLRGYIPRLDESISDRNRKSTRRWTDPFGLLRDREPESVEAAVGETTPLPGPAEATTSAAEFTDTTETAQGSEAMLPPLIAQVEQELAQWPMLPNNKPQNELEWRRRQTDLRMLYLIAGRSAESIRVIESLPEKEQEFWQSMMLAMESYRRSDDSAARAEQLTETLEYVRTASRQLQPLSTMKIRRLNFCNRIDGFGSFSVFPTSDFNAGQPLLLYAEIENYRSELTSDGQYRSEFAAMIEFFREGETEPITSRNIQLPKIEDLCSAERTDYFQSYELTVPTLSPGRYTLRLRVWDQLSLQSATTELPFDIRPLGSQQ